MLNNVQVPGLCGKWKGIARGEQFGAIEDELYLSLISASAYGRSAYCYPSN